MQNLLDKIPEAKESRENLTALSGKLKPHSSPHDLKARLQWRSPDLAILDVRGVTASNEDRIVGAVPVSEDRMVQWAQSNLVFSQDIYVYGETDGETATAAAKLRAAGFASVAELRGGLAAWKAIAGPTAAT